MINMLVNINSDGGISMKKILLLVLLSVFVCGIYSHNSRLALDWAGSYSGTVPGASGPGIFVQITLNWDYTYEATYHYIDEDELEFTFTGVFTWDEAGGTITLDSERIASHYKVGEGVLLQLDIEGNVITGEFAEMYKLRLDPLRD